MNSGLLTADETKVIAEEVAKHIWVADGILDDFTRGLSKKRRR